uniref:Signal recognition particle subunit SRP68 n=1 Tax=Lotharella globosa TaxID=91324 RepID=A0A7S3ZB70_9EUKA
MEAGAGQDKKADSKAGESKGTGRLTLAVLTTIKDSQSQYGLRHDDYTRYRQYCARRLRRVRKSEKFLHGRQNFRKKKLESKHVKNEKLLSIPLLNAERAWSYAMELKKESAKDDDSRKHHHLLRKLSRAVRWSKDLRSLAMEVADDRTQVEAELYAIWMEGNEHIERENWKSALQCHAKAKEFCERLKKASNMEDAERVEEMRKQMIQSIRLCKYNAKRDFEKKEDLEKFVKESQEIDSAWGDKLAKLTEAFEAQKSTTSTTVVSWKGKDIPIGSKKIQDALKAAQDLEEKMGKADGSAQSEAPAESEALIEILKKYTEAHCLCQNDLIANEGAKLRTVVLDKKAEYLKLLKSFLGQKRMGYKLLRAQSHTDNLAAKYESQVASNKKLSKKEARIGEGSLVAAYEKLLAVAHELKKYADESKDSKSLREITAIQAGYRSMRCYYKAVQEEKASNFPRAYVLYKHSGALAQDATKKLKDQSNQQKLLSQLESMQSNLRQRELRTRANAVLKQSVSENTASDSAPGVDSKERKTCVPLLERLDKFDSESDIKLANFPLDVQLAPPKPLFYDVAYHTLGFKSLAKRVESEKEKSGGLLSSLGLW